MTPAPLTVQLMWDDLADQALGLPHYATAWGYTYWFLHDRKRSFEKKKRLQRKRKRTQPNANANGNASLRSS